MTRCDFLRAVCLLWLGTGLVAAGAHVWTLLPPVLTYILLAADGALRPGSGWLMPVIRHGARSKALVAFSFDDGPDERLTPLVLDVLKRHHARATFFVIGRRAEAHPELIRRMAGEGHEIANHSYSHSRLLNLRFRKSLKQDITHCSHVLSQLQLPGVSPALFRPPMGLKNPALAHLQRELDLRIVVWSLHGRDTHGADAETITKRVLRRIRRGDIILFHDGHDLPGKQRSAAVVEALERILPALAERGLRTSTVGELISDQ